MKNDGCEIEPTQPESPEPVPFHYQMSLETFNQIKQMLQNSELIQVDDISSILKLDQAQTRPLFGGSK